MAVPDVQTMIRPALVVLNDGVPHSVRYIRDALSFELDVSEADMEVLLPSGKQTAYANRVGWVLVYLGRAGLVTREGRGLYAITEAGVTALHRYPERIDLTTLRAYPSFAEFRNRPVHAAAERRASGGVGAATMNGARYVNFDATDNAHAQHANGAATNGANGHRSVNGYAAAANGHRVVREPVGASQQHDDAWPDERKTTYPETHSAPTYGAHHSPEFQSFDMHTECSCGHRATHTENAHHSSANASQPLPEPTPQRQQPWAFLTCMALIPLRIVDHTGRAARDIIDAVEHCSNR